MVSLTQLADIYGQDEGALRHAYLGHKNTGGTNNAKGNSFENYFTTYRIAQLIDEGCIPNQTVLSSQIKCFVDDLIIEDTNNTKAKYYQIKDVLNLSWNHGNNYTIEDDFIMQMELSVVAGIDATFKIIVSDNDLRDRLSNTIPESIEKQTQVQHFTTAKTINQLIAINPEFKNAIVQICALNNPTSDKLESIATIILGVWDATDKHQITLEQILSDCYNINPHYIKGNNQRLSVKLTQTLNSVDNFTFTVENGYLVWQYNGTDSGVLEHVIGSQEFMQWENDVNNIAPIQAFEELEHYLSKEYGKGI